MSTFALDPTHSSVEFSVRHMMFSKVRGVFGSFSLELAVDDATSLPSSVKAEIDAASIDTKVADRDAHLRSADFLDVEKFPKIAFESTAITGKANAFTIAGNLTIHGVTKPIALDATLGGRAKDPWGNDRIAYEASTKINRKEFGLTWNQALEAGGVLVGEDIEITLTIQAVKVGAPAAV
ncbi:MAG: YceI family protein [bacterium]|nr:YceI family protein [bacterium]